MLLPRCDPTSAADYSAVKKFLLQEFQLSPGVYLDQFTKLVHDTMRRTVNFVQD